MFGTVTGVKQNRVCVSVVFEVSVSSLGLSLAFGKEPSGRGFGLCPTLCWCWSLCPLLWLSWPGPFVRNFTRISCGKELKFRCDHYLCYSTLYTTYSIRFYKMLSDQNLRSFILFIQIAQYFDARSLAHVL